MATIGKDGSAGEFGHITVEPMTTCGCGSEDV